MRERGDKGEGEDGVRVGLGGFCVIVTWFPRAAVRTWILTADVKSRGKKGTFPKTGQEVRPLEITERRERRRFYTEG